MNILFNQKFRLTLGFAGLLLVSLASSYLYTQSKTKQVAQQNQAFTQQENSAPLPSHISFTSTFQNPFVGEQKIDKQNAPSSQQDLLAASAPYPVIDEFKKYKYSVNGSQIFTGRNTVNG